MASPQDIIIGIDLGTTYSCVSVYKDGKPIIFDDDLGNKTVASYVSFTEKEFLVGQAAKNLCPINGPNTVYDVKRILGRDFNDPELQRDIKHFPFQVLPDEITNQPIIGVTYKGQQRYFKPEQISALVLQRLKYIAELRLGHPITKAVITVPAYYGDAQRSATIAAAQLAGLEVVRLLNEPTAAAFAFGIKQQQLNVNVAGQDKPRNVLVFDLGGGTFDVSILQLKGNDFTVLATSGDAHLGGEDFDITLMRFIMHTYKTKVGVDLDGNQNAIRRLKRACEDAKIALSTTLKTTISIDNIIPGQDLELELSRARFEQLCNKYFQQCLPPVQKALEAAGLSKTEIDDIVMIGGSTRIPAIQKVISDYFDGKQVAKSINPDEAVSIGAAIQAATLSTHPEQSMGEDNIMIQDVTPLDLGIAIVNDQLSIILPHNTPIPTTQTQRYVTSLDNQTDMIIDILEGNHPQASANSKLGTVMLSNITPKPAGAISADISFSYDANGVVSCSAQCVDVATGEVISTAEIAFPKRAQISPETMLILKQENIDISREQDELNKQRLRDLQSQLGDREAALEQFRQAIQRVCQMIQDAGPEVLQNSKHATDLLMKVLKLLQQIASGNFNLEIEEMKQIEQEISKEVDQLIRELKLRQREKGLIPEHVAKQPGYFD